MRKSLLLLPAVGVAGLAAAGWIFLSPPGGDSQPLWQVSSPAWSATLGGEDEITQDDLDALDSYSFNLSQPSVESVKTLAALTSLSKLTDAPTGFNGYDRPSQPVSTPRTPACKDTTLLAASPLGVRYGDDLWAKTMVVYSGECGSQTFTRSSPGVTYEYALLTEDQWVPVHSWQTPGSGGDSQDLREVPGAMSSLTCQGTSYDFEARVKVSTALEQLCDQAAEEGVGLSITGGYRTASEQEELYSKALEAYGSQATDFVSFSDGVNCLSAFCQGWAVATSPEDATWLSAQAGCLRDSGEFIKGTECKGSPVSNAERYGFASPTTDQPSVLEYVAPAGLGPDFKTEADCYPYGMPAAATVAAVFRCRLAEEGVPLPVREEVVATALAVAECSSGLNPQATVFGGQYVTSPKPGTDRTFPMGGLFGLAAADPTWQSGDLGDAVASANYAAKLWLASRSFSDFFCATGADPDLQVAGVDPAFNPSTELPSWVKDW